MDLHPKDQLSYVISEFEALASGKKTLIENIPCLRKDGAIIYADINSDRIEVDGVTTVVRFFRDVTERGRAEKELRLKDAAMAGSITAIAIANLDRTVRYVNDAFLKLFNYNNPDEVVEAARTTNSGGRAKRPRRSWQRCEAAQVGSASTMEGAKTAATFRFSCP